jgi:uncharacterized protein YdeI (BOF family)
LEDFMKNRSLLFTSALALFLSAAIGLNAQSTPSSTTPPDTQAQQPSTPDQTAPPTTTAPTQDQATPAPSQNPEKTEQAAPDASANGATAVQTFSGNVVKSGDKFVLQDESGTTYDTDHQDEMAKFEGKRVKVHGTLDASGKMIHVQ